MCGVARYDGDRGRHSPRRARHDARPAHRRDRATGDSDDPRHGPARSARGRHHPDPLDRRRPAGELRAPGRADGHGADGLRAVDPPPPPRADEPGTGPTATGSCCRPATRRCSCTRCSTSPGYDVSLDDLKSFRQWGSITPGHPEYGLTPGVEATTGPLGQGLGNAVGMAIAERRLAAEFNRPGHDIVDHRTYVIASDGDLQEGVASEASSLAGHLRLGKLDRPVRRQPDPARRPDGAGRSARTCSGGSRPTAGTPSGSRTAPTSPRSRPPSTPPRPTTGRRSSPSAPTSASAARTSRTPRRRTGRRSGPDEVRLDQGGLRLGPGPHVLRAGRGRGSCSVARSTRARTWSPSGSRGSTAYAAAFPADAAELERRLLGRLPDGWDAGLPAYEVGTEVATRNASQDTIQALAAAAARAVRRLGGPVGVEPDRRQGERPGPLRGGPRRAEPALRRPRARHGRRSRTASPTTAASSPTARRS